jgi:predicted small lipoprotein YifL
MPAVKTHMRTLTAAMAVLMMGMTIAGCAEKEPNTTMSEKPTPEKTLTAREGRDRVIELVINTTKQLDVTGWWPRNGVAGAQECSLGKGEEGASYSYDHWAPQGTNHIDDAKRVAEYWKSLGMTVRTVNPTTHPTVFAESGPVLRAEFDTDASDKSYSVGATAPCSVGDAWELNVEDQAERDQGKVLPGDEGVVVQEDPPQ